MSDTIRHRVGTGPAVLFFINAVCRSAEEKHQVKAAVDATDGAVPIDGVNVVAGRVILVDLFKSICVVGCVVGEADVARDVVSFYKLGLVCDFVDRDADDIFWNDKFGDGVAAFDGLIS